MPSTDQSQSGQTAPALYPLTNGNHPPLQLQPHQRKSHKTFSRCFGGAKSPPPQLLPAVQSRFSRVPPNLLPMSGHSHSSASSTFNGTGLSSYGLHSNCTERHAPQPCWSSTPKWPTVGGRGPSSGTAPMSLQRSVLVDANVASSDYARLSAFNNGCGIGDNHTASTTTVVPRKPAAVKQLQLPTTSTSTATKTTGGSTAAGKLNPMDFIKYTDYLSKLDLNSPQAYINLKGECNGVKQVPTS